MNLPLVMGSPLSIEDGTMIVIGIPPISDVSCKKLHAIFEISYIILYNDIFVTNLFGIVDIKIDIYIP